MKTTNPMLFLFLTIFLFSNLKQGFCVVIDTEGNEVQAGTDYYILPVFRGRGGGLTLADTGRHNDTFNCPLDVVQARGELDNGLPLTFLPVTQEAVVRVSTDLNIMFYDILTICFQSTVWTLDSVDESTGQRFVTTGGVEGNPGPETLNNWFRIENYNDDYKLVFCPTVCDICRPACGDIGVYIDENGMRRLAISTVPLGVRFRKIVSLDHVI